MITFFYESVKKLKEENNPYWKYLYKVNKVLVNLLFPISQRWRKSGGLDENSRIVVSLTTYPARAGSVWITIASLLQQTMPPYKVILWLAEEQFKDRRIAKNLKRMQKRGLDIRYCEDLKSHKKYYYAMQEYPDYYILTADDDIFYPEDHIEKLWKGHEKYQDTIICHWSHRVGINSQKDFYPYNDWIDNAEEEPSYATLAVGCNGILYPPGSLPRETFRKQTIMEAAFYTDDLWLKCMEILNKRKTVNCNKTILIYFNRLSTKDRGLWNSNIGQEKRNDSSWDRLMELYPEVKEMLVEEALKTGK
jgi:hypothetical protein